MSTRSANLRCTLNMIKCTIFLLLSFYCYWSHRWRHNCLWRCVFTIHEMNRRPIPMEPLYSCTEEDSWWEALRCSLYIMKRDKTRKFPNFRFEPLTRTMAEQIHTHLFVSIDYRLSPETVRSRTMETGKLKKFRSFPDNWKTARKCSNTWSQTVLRNTGLIRER